MKATLRAGGRTVGRVTVSFTKPGTRTARVRTTRRLPRRISVRLTATDIAGNRATVRRTVTLRR